jgi:adenosylhomocysteine nucleosidase
VAQASGRRHGDVTGFLVLTAIDLEARALARHLGLDRVGGCDRAYFRGGRLEVASVGVRAAFLGERAAPAPDMIVVAAGACGGLAPDLAPGALVVPEVVIDASGRRFPTDPLAGLARAGTLLTVSDVVATPRDKARLWIETGALAVDMETAVVMAWARAHGVAAAAVRAVADSATAAIPADLAAAVEPTGRVRAGQALRAALARPRAVADALALKRSTDAALKAVAAALGRAARPCA